MKRVFLESSRESTNERDSYELLHTNDAVKDSFRSNMVDMISSSVFLRTRMKYAMGKVRDLYGLW